MSKKKKKNKKKYSRRKKKNQINYKDLYPTIILFILVLSLAYLIFSTNLLKPQINELTTSYISFNNKNTTDMLKVSNLKKMNNAEGISNLNNSSLDFTVTGEKNQEYEIVIYPIINDIDYKYINYSLNSNNNIIKKDILEKTENSSDEGRIIYIGKVNNKKLTLKMWINNKYKEKINDNSFEVKIKPR